MIDEIIKMLYQPYFLIPLSFFLLILRIVLNRIFSSFKIQVNRRIYVIICILIIFTYYIIIIEKGNIQNILLGIRWLFSRIYIIYGIVIFFYIVFNFYLIWRFRKRKKINVRKIGRLISTSYIYNIYVLAVPTLLMLYLVAAFLKLNSYSIEVVILTIIALIIPTIFGYYKAAGVGEWCGIIGNYLGLLVYSLVVKDIDFWYSRSILYIILNILGHQAGWFGSWAIRGKTYSSVVVSRFTLKVDDQKHFFESLHLFQTRVQDIFRLHFGKKPTLKIVQKDYMIAIDNTGNSLMANFRKEIICSIRLSPVMLIFKRIIEGNTEKIWDEWHLISNEQLFAVANNFFRFITSRIVFDVSDSNSINEIRILVITYNETPTIIWNNKTSEMLSHKLHKAFIDFNKRKNDITIEADTNVPMQWVKQYAHPPLEVQVMQPNIGSNILRKSLSFGKVQSSLKLIQRLFMPNSVITKLRKKGLIFILLVQNVIVALLVSQIEKYIKSLF